MIWQNRKVKIEEGNWLMSAVGQHDLWDFAPIKPSADQAVAGSMPGKLKYEYDGTGEPHFEPAAPVRMAVKLDENRLLLIGADWSTYIIVGNPVDNGRVYDAGPNDVLRSETGTNITS